MKFELRIAVNEAERREVGGQLLVDVRIKGLVGFNG